MMVGVKAFCAAGRRYLPGSPFKAPAPGRPAETFAVIAGTVGPVGAPGAFEVVVCPGCRAKILVRPAGA